MADSTPAAPARLLPSARCAGARVGRVGVVQREETSASMRGQKSRRMGWRVGAGSRRGVMPAHAPELGRSTCKRAWLHPSPHARTCSTRRAALGARNAAYRSRPTARPSRIYPSRRAHLHPPPLTRAPAAHGARRWTRGTPHTGPAAAASGGSTPPSPPVTGGVTRGVTGCEHGHGSVERGRPTRNHPYSDSHKHGACVQPKALKNTPQARLADPPPCLQNRADRNAAAHAARSSAAREPCTTRERAKHPTVGGRCADPRGLLLTCAAAHAAHAPIRPALSPANAPRCSALRPPLAAGSKTPLAAGSKLPTPPLAPTRPPLAAGARTAACWCAAG